MEFDSDDLRRKAIEGINRNLNVSTPRYRLKQGAQRSEATREQLGEDDVRYDFVSTYEELMDKVMV